MIYQFVQPWCGGYDRQYLSKIIGRVKHLYGVPPYCIDRRLTSDVDLLQQIPVYEKATSEDAAGISDGRKTQQNAPET